MKRVSFKPWVLLKTFIALFSIVFISLVMLGMKANEVMFDVWQQLGISQPDANRNIINSVNSGSFSYHGIKNIKSIAEGNRVALVNEAGMYAKKYVASEEFKKEYARLRELRKPKPVELMEMPLESELRAKEKERIEQAIKSTEANANNPNPKIKNAVPARLEALKKELAAVNEPDNKNIKRQMDDVTRMNAAITKQYDQAMLKYQTDFPEDPKVLIKKRLQEILDITADVDYGAELKDGYGKTKIFANSLYERKRAEWKLAYRVGKPVTDAARAFAEKWLKELK